jgi:hypothetical protein
LQNVPMARQVLACFRPIRATREFKTGHWR